MSGKETRPEIPSNPETETVHKCHDWFGTAYSHDVGDDDFYHSEIFSEHIFLGLMNYDMYKEDMKSSIDFVNNFVIPDNQRVHMLYKPGCKVCYNELIPSVAHYLLLKGYCDIKTIQYYLFSKGIFLKSFVLEKHMEHINVENLISDDQASENKDALDIINEEIDALRKDLREAYALGSTSEKRTSSLRRQLREYLELKSRIEQESGMDSGDRTMTFNDLYNMINTNKKDKVNK